MKLFALPAADELSKLDFKNPATWICTWFGCGLMRPAPGTWGTLGALPIGLILMALGGTIGLIFGLLFLLPLAFWAVKRFESMTGTHDSGMIVIDEVAGMWIALLACVGAHPAYIVAAFLLFRLLDITKPFPCGWLDRNLSGAEGVLLDDLMAGVYTVAILIGVRYALAG